MSAGKLEWAWGRYGNVAFGLLSFNAKEIRDLAYMYGPSDGADEELLAFADEVDSANKVGAAHEGDDLTPAEQARAARWAADWLATEAYVGGTAIGGTAIVELRQYADKLDPPETVESLRAERDAEHDAWERTEDALRQCRDERDEARSDGAHWQEQFRLVCDESEDRKNDLVRLRATHTEAEAAGERCEQQPRVWKSGDPEPVDVEWVRDDEDDEWHKESANWWQCSVVPSSRTWSSLMYRFGPLIEVLSED